MRLFAIQTLHISRVGFSLQGLPLAIWRRRSSTGRKLQSRSSRLPYAVRLSEATALSFSMRLRYSSADAAGVGRARRHASVLPTPMSSDPVELMRGSRGHLGSLWRHFQPCGSLGTRSTAARQRRDCTGTGSIPDCETVHGASNPVVWRAKSRTADSCNFVKICFLSAFDFPGPVKETCRRAGG